MSEIPVIPPPSSPEPMIPPRAAKWVWLVWSVLSATVVPAIGIVFGPTSKEAGVALLIAMSLAPTIRYLTTNSFASPPPVALLLAGVLALPGCSAAQRIGQATVDCSAKEMQVHAVSLGPVLGDILTGDDWRPGVAQLAIKVGAAVVRCAMEAALAEARSAIGKQAACGWAMSCLSGSDPYAEIKRARIEAWLKENGYEVP